MAMSEHQKRGRYLCRSDVPVKVGQLIITERPFAYILSSKERKLRCDYCVLKDTLQMCKGCQYTYYCNRACQKHGWKEHKWECGQLKLIYPRDVPDAARMVLRLINVLHKGDGKTRQTYYKPQMVRMWKDLMSHYPDMKNDTKRLEHFASICGVLKDLMANDTLPNSAELLGIYGRMCINSFNLLDMEMCSIGTALYLGASLLDHSCKPNAVATFEGTVISVRATVDMPCLDWSKLRICYIDMMKIPLERQLELKKRYYFVCQCESCTDPRPLKQFYAAKCQTLGCLYPIRIPWKIGLRLRMRPPSQDKNVSPGKNDVSPEVMSPPSKKTPRTKDLSPRSKSTSPILKEISPSNSKNSSPETIDVALPEKQYSGKGNSLSRRGNSQERDGNTSSKLSSSNESTPNKKVPFNREVSPLARDSGLVSDSSLPTPDYPSKPQKKDRSNSKNRRNTPLRVELLRRSVSRERDEKEEAENVSNQLGEERTEFSLENRGRSRTKQSQTDSITCGQCRIEVSYESIKKFKETMEFTEIHLNNMRNCCTSFIDVCKFCLDKQKDVLHPYNIMHAETLDLAFEAAISFEHWDHALEYADKLIPCFRLYLGEMHPLLGLLYVKQAKIMNLLGNYKDAYVAIRSGVNILRVTHGPQHSLMTKMVYPILERIKYNKNESM